MPITIDATVGGASANSFVTLAEAVSYLDGRTNASAFTDAGLDSQKRALVEATRDLTLLGWAGTRTDATQALSWPRQYAVDPDAPAPVDPDDSLVWPVYFDSDEIPTRVKDATIELALEWLRAGTTDLAGPDPLRNVIRKKVDVLETEYSKPTQRRYGIGQFTRVMTLVGPLLNQATAGLTLVRV